jgi:hypothetical protein
MRARIHFEVAGEKLKRSSEIKYGFLLTNAFRIANRLEDFWKAKERNVNLYERDQNCW